MTSRVDPILDLIDGALADPGQRSPESDLYADVAPAMPDAGTCWRCTTTPAAHGSELCAGCRAYLLEDSEDDPCGATVTTALNGYLFVGQGPALPLVISDEMYQWVEEPAATSRTYQEFVTLRVQDSGFPWADGDRIAITATWGNPADVARLDFEEALQRLQDATSAPLDTLRTVLQDTIDKIGLSPHAAADSLIRLSNAFVEAPDDPPPSGPRNRTERRADRFGRTITTTNAGPRPAWTHRAAR